MTGWTERDGRYFKRISRKGEALVFEGKTEGGLRCRVLRSYDTYVAYAIQHVDPLVARCLRGNGTGEYNVCGYTDETFSATTTKHVNAFLKGEASGVWDIVQAVDHDTLVRFCRRGF
jgi:hypothetical protein